MKKKTWLLRLVGLCALLLTLFNLCGRLRAGFPLPDGDGYRLGVYPSVPFPVIGFLLAFSLTALGVVRRDAHPLTVLPALTLGSVWLFLSDTPLFSVAYSPTSFQIMPAALVLLALASAQLYRGLAGPETAPFRLREALLLCLGLLVLYAFCLADHALTLLRQSLRSVRVGAVACSVVQALLFLLSGFSCWPLLARGQRGSGLALLCVSAASAALCLLLSFWPAFLFAMQTALPRLVSSHSDVSVLSFTGVLLAAGVKALLPAQGSSTPSN